MFDVYV